MIDQLKQVKLMGKVAEEVPKSDFSGLAEKQAKIRAEDAEVGHELSRLYANITMELFFLYV